jgi:hypothetical protein
MHHRFIRHETYNPMYMYTCRQPNIITDDSTASAIDKGITKDTLSLLLLLLLLNKNSFLTLLISYIALPIWLILLSLALKPP